MKCLEEAGGELGIEWAQASLCPRFLHMDTAILSTLTLEVAVVSSVPSASVSYLPSFSSLSWHSRQEQASEGRLPGFES